MAPSGWDSAYHQSFLKISLVPWKCQYTMMDQMYIIIQQLIKPVSSLFIATKYLRTLHQILLSHSGVVSQNVAYPISQAKVHQGDPMEVFYN